MALWVGVFAAKADHLGSNCRTRDGRREPASKSCPVLHTRAVTPPRPLLHIHTVKKTIIQKQTTDWRGVWPSVLLCSLWARPQSQWLRTRMQCESHSQRGLIDSNFLLILDVGPRWETVLPCRCLATSLQLRGWALPRE